MKRLVFIFFTLSLLFNSTYVAQAATSPTPIFTKMLVNATQLNVRTKPDVKASKLMVISKGTELTAIALQDGWVKVALSTDKIGWVSGDYVYTKNTEPVKKIITNSAFVVSKEVSLRAGAGENFPVITKLAKESVVSFIYNTDKWALVRLPDGKQGFVLQSFGRQAGVFLSSWEETSATPTFVQVGTETPSTENNNPTSPPPSHPSSNTEDIKVLSIDGNNSRDVIQKISAIRKSEEFDITITTSTPVSFSSRQDGNQIMVTIQDAQGISEGRYDLISGGLDVLEVSRSGSDTLLTIFASAESTFTTQRLADQNQFVIKIPMTGDMPPAIGNLLVGKTIVLDAGHGGMQYGSPDPGANGTVSGIKERDVVLDITKKTRDILQMQGATVLMTREDISTPLSLNGRAKLANDNNADVFVAIHANASTSPTLAGTSTYFYAPADKPLGAQREVRKTFAQTVQQALVEKLQRRNIGVLEANFQVLRDTTVPSILVETAFLTNSEEETLLADELFRKSAAEGIAQGLINFLTK